VTGGSSDILTVSGESAALVTVVTVKAVTVVTQWQLCWQW
jgi:hypothetical protein